MSESMTQADTQKQRWLKYGANVGVVSIVVVVLAGLVTYLAQRFDRRVDTTSSGLYSLKPQTINIIRGNTQPVKIVSLYTRMERDDVLSTRQQSEVDRASVVADLLDEYKRKGNKIDVDVIDSVEQPTKVDALINEVSLKYGGEVKKYEALVKSYPETYDKLSAAAAEEMKKVAALPEIRTSDIKLAVVVGYTVNTMQELKGNLDAMKQNVDQKLKGTKIPDYKGATGIIGESMSELSSILEVTLGNFAKYKDDNQIPKELRDYMTQSLPRYEAIKKMADELSKRIKDLGELKLDDLRQTLEKEKREAILVMGPTEMRVLSRDKIWQTPRDVRGFTNEGKPRERFAGEQQVTSAILAVTAASKPKVVFVRPGGAPLTSPGMGRFMPPGPLSIVADRLRDYNYEVLEKDMSGRYAMQAQMQGMPAGPDATDEQMKDALWIVIAAPSERTPMPMPASMGAKLAEHLKNGGSALVLAVPDGENLAEALGPWGVKLRTDAVIMHEKIPAPAAPSSDLLDEILRSQQILFVMKEYGDHPLTRPLKSLDSLMLPLVPVQIEPKSGYHATALLPVPQNMKVWGETNIRSINDEDTPAVYDPPKDGVGGDLPPPLFAGAAVDKEGAANRLVVIGCFPFIYDDILRHPLTVDPELARQSPPVYVSRFPGNAELFCNAVFWLTHRDELMAISPAAMEVSRVNSMSDAAQMTWRVGALALPPFLVILAGFIMYVRRRD